MNINELEGEELDAKVATEVMGWKRQSIYSWRSPEDGHRYLPKFSTDISAAWLVVEKMRERGIYIAIVAQKDDYLITASDFHPHINCYHYLLDLRVDSFEKLPEAICRAALKAVEEK